MSSWKLFSFQSLAGWSCNGIPLISPGATTTTSSLTRTHPDGKFGTDSCIIATSLPVFSIQDVGQEETSCRTIQPPLESSVIPGAVPTLTGTCSTICPAPFPFDIRILMIPTSPATASSGGVTFIVIIPVPPGSIIGPLFGRVTFHPWPAFAK